MLRRTQIYIGTSEYRMKAFLERVSSTVSFVTETLEISMDRSDCLMDSRGRGRELELLLIVLLEGSLEMFGLLSRVCWFINIQLKGTKFTDF